MLSAMRLSLSPFSTVRSRLSTSSWNLTHNKKLQHLNLNYAQFVINPCVYDAYLGLNLGPG